MDTNKKWYKDKEAEAFLCSASYRNFLYDIAYGMAGETVYLKFIEYGDDLGYSDGKTININLMPEIFKDCTLLELTVYHIALIVHEYSHVMYTAFRFVRESAGVTKEKRILKDIFNLICDGRIERISSYKLPGYSPSLYALNKAIKDSRKVDKVKTEFEYLFYTLWDYAKLGIVPDNVPDNLLEDWSQIRKMCREARLSDKCEVCYNLSKQVADIFVKYAPDNYSLPQSALRNFEGKGQGKNGNSNGQDYLPSDDDLSEGQTNSDSSLSSGEKSSDKNSDSTSNSEKSNGKEEQPNEDSESSSNSKKSDSKEESQKDSLNNGSSTGNNDEDKSSENDTASSLEEKLKKFFEEMEERLGEAKEMFEEENRANTHDHSLFTRCVNENPNMALDYAYPTDSCIEAYNTVKTKTAGIISNMKRKLQNVLKFNDDEIIRRISRGRVDGKSMTNVINGRICSSCKEKSEETDLNITFILDRSGSMMGNSEMQTIAASVIMEEALELLKIPYSFVCFGSRITILNHWKQKTKNRKYSLMNYTIEGSTELTGAVKIVHKSFVSKQKNNDKIVFIITDGYPDNINSAQKAINSLKKDCQVFGLGIEGASDEEAFNMLFGKESYIYIDNLERLPIELTNIIKKNLLRKD